MRVPTLIFLIVVPVLIGLLSFGMVREHRRVSALQEKGERYDVYCQQLKLTLRDFATELRESRPSTRDTLAITLLDRLEARYSADDVMACGTKAVDLKRFQQCLGGPRAMTDTDRDCLIGILTEAETSIPAWRVTGGEP